MTDNWGGEPLIVHGQKKFVSPLEGFMACREEKILGFILFERHEKDWEIIVFEVLSKFAGIGTKLLNTLIEYATERQCPELLVMTTNDNLDALRFYQKRGFIITGFHLDIVKKARIMKPSIGELGDYDIPIRDEILMTLTLCSTS